MAVHRFLARLFGRPAQPAAAASAESDDSSYYATRFVDPPQESRRTVAWSHRGPDREARMHDAALGVEALSRVWAQDRAMAAVGSSNLALIASYFDYAEIEAGKRVIGQDERGDYLVVVLQGAVAEERTQPSGARIRLGESRAGDLLGELSVLDGGTRFCTCTALSPLTLAVLPQSALDRLLADEPRLGAALMAWMARQLSQRLRQTSARLTALLTRLPAAPR